MEYFGDAVVLCGGSSRRMSFDKTYLRFEGRYLLEIIIERLKECFTNVRLCSKPNDKLSLFKSEVIEDLYEGKKGPAVGIYSSLIKAESKYVFVTACDMPFIDIQHIEFMKNQIKQGGYTADALVPMNKGYIEPLYSFYSIDMAKIFEQEIEDENYMIQTILNKGNTVYMQDKLSREFENNLKMFTNINYIADFENL